MAKQKGLIQIEGSIGNLNFYKSGNRFLVREKTGIDGKRISNDPKFQRTRENMEEFTKVANSISLLRDAFRHLIFGSKDSKMTNRLSKVFYEVIKADKTSNRGKRNVIDGEVNLLQGFEFNGNSKLFGIVLFQIVSSIDRASGECTIDLPAFKPSLDIIAPEGATHFRFISGAAAIDFNGATHESVYEKGEDISLLSPNNVVMQITHSLGINITVPIFMVLGIEFSQELNGKMYPLSSGTFNPLSIIKVDSI